MSSWLIEGGIATLGFGALLSVMACASGLALPVLWPTKDHDKADKLLLVVYGIGFACSAVGVVLLLVGRFA
jgi:hypothetical protein